MRRRRPSAVVTAIALLTALAVAIPQSYASRGNARQVKKPVDRKKGNERGAGRGTGRESTRPGHGPVGAGTANPLARRPAGASRGTGTSRSGTRTAAVTSSAGKTRGGKATTSGGKKLGKTSSKRQMKQQTRRARVKPLPGRRTRKDGGQAVDAAGAEGSYDREQIGDDGDFDPSPDDSYQERGKKGLSSVVKKGLKVLGMGVLAVGIGVVFMAGGAPLMALSVPVMMFAIGAGQIIAKPDVDPNQMMVPPGMGGGLNDDNMTPQERYRFLARDSAAGGNLPGGLPSRQGLQPPPAMDMGN